VIATDLTPPHQTARRIGPTATALQLDVMQEEDWRLAAVKSPDVGVVDIVMNNAGYFPNCPIEERRLRLNRMSKSRHAGTTGHQANGGTGDVTGAILFLTSDDSAFITGQAIVVDGGQYRIG
jgi:NAD(P)-dependent dehydrogenase (short-subunit alcohol dehydrogenase family)